MPRRGFYEKLVKSHGVAIRSAITSGDPSPKRGAQDDNVSDYYARNMRPSYANSESANDCESKGSRSPAFSPTPTYRTGTPSSREIATTTPPLAVPSSFVSTMPVTPADCVNCRAC